MKKKTGSRSPVSAADFLVMFREFAALDKRRGVLGLTPLDFHRWRDLKGRLGKRFQQRGVGKPAVNLPTLLRLEFATAEEFADSKLPGLASGDGMFINTPFTMPVGRSFVARVHIEDTGEEVDLPCAVVSSNVGADHSTLSMGMGVRFVGLSGAQQAKLRELRAEGQGGDSPASEATPESQAASGSDTGTASDAEAGLDAESGL